MSTDTMTIKEAPHVRKWVLRFLKQNPHISLEDLARRYWIDLFGKPRNLFYTDGFCNQARKMLQEQKTSKQTQSSGDMAATTKTTDQQHTSIKDVVVVERLSDETVRLMEEIPRFIQGWGRDVSFVELSKHIDGFMGDCAYMANAEKCPNIILWNGISENAWRALCELLLAEVLDVKSCSYLTYLLDGSVMRLPIAKRLRGYKKLHWMPVVFNLDHNHKEAPLISTTKQQQFCGEKASRIL